MTTYERGDIVEIGDPFNEAKASRPFLLVNTEAHPFHGEQYVAVTLTTKEWYDDTVALADDDFLEGGVPAESYVVPWGVVSPARGDIHDWFGRVESAVATRAVEELHGYLVP